MKISHSFHCFCITKICVAFEHFPWAKQSLNLLQAFVFYCGIFIAVLKWGTWGVWFHNKQTLNHKEETKQNTTEATSPQCPGWSHRQPEQRANPARAAEPGWGCREAAQPQPLWQTAPDTRQHSLLTGDRDTPQIRHCHNSGSSDSKILLT